MFKTNETSAVYCGYLVRDTWVKGHVFRHLLRVLSAHDFNYPKILFHQFEEEFMLFQATKTVLGKSMYQNAFSAAENGLNIHLSFSCLEP